MTHTPGPWELKMVAGGFAVIIPRMGLKGKADARLIAAAPELLEALELCAEFIATELPQEEWHRKVYAAIAKAKGE